MIKTASDVNRETVRPQVATQRLLSVLTQTSAGEYGSADGNCSELMV